MTVKWNFLRIWITMTKSSVEWVPEYHGFNERQRILPRVPVGLISNTCQKIKQHALPKTHFGTSRSGTDHISVHINATCIPSFENKCHLLMKLFRVEFSKHINCITVHRWIHPHEWPAMGKAFPCCDFFFCYWWIGISDIDNVLW